MTNINTVIAQTITSGNVFLKGRSIEVGISPNQSFGSGVGAPTGYHPRGSGTQLGFVSDPALDGWTVGTPNYIGDYFLPGVPQEGWDVSINGTWYRAYRDFGSTSFLPAVGFSGSNTDVFTAGTRIGSVWNGAIDHLSIRATTSLDTLQTFFRVDVVMKNTGTTTISNIYYSRTLDPDNESVVPGGGGASTTNNIEFQPNLATGDYRALVSAVGLNYPALSYLGLGTVDCRAKAYILDWDLVPWVGPHNIDVGTGYPFHYDLDYASVNDVAVGLIFNIGNLAPGDSTTFSYTYILNRDDLDTAMTSLATGFNIDGVPYTAVRDTVLYENCGASDSIEVNIIGGGSFNWGTWLPGTGISMPSGSYNKIEMPSSPITYRIIGVNPTCLFNDTLYLTIVPPTATETIYDTICTGETYNFNGVVLSTAGIYHDTFTTVGTVCDSIVSLHLHMILSSTTTIIDTICEGGSIYGYTTSGIHIDTFTNIHGCDSIRILHLSVIPTYYNPITLTLCRNDLPYIYGSISIPTGAVSTMNYDTIAHTSIHGCDSFEIIHLTIHEVSSSTFTDTICIGASFFGYSVTGTYYDTFTNANGCDSIRTVHLSVINTDVTIINDTICQGESSLGYSLTGTYYDTFSNLHGCDSIRIFNLIVNPTFTFTVIDTICAGSSSHGYNTTGIYIDTFSSIHGCDSIRTLQLFVRPNAYISSNLTICRNNLPYTYGAITIPTSAITTMNYDTITHTSMHGCDSFEILNLTIHELSSSTFMDTICIGESFLGYSVSGTYYDTFTNANGCDSIRTVILTVINTDITIVNDSICPGENLFGYTSAGIYYDTFVNMHGCDSIRILHLEVLPILTSTFTDTICEGGSFMGYNLTGVYNDTFTSSLGCDSIRTVHVTVIPNSTQTLNLNFCRNELPYSDGFISIPLTAVSNPTYASVTHVNVHGCDSTVIYNVTIRDTSAVKIDTTVCFGVVFNWNDIIISAEGNYTSIANNAIGCDSFTTLQVHYSPAPITNTETINECGSASVNGITYTTDTMLYDTIINAIGCDSIYNVTNVIIRHIAYDTIIAEICRGESYNFNGITYSNTTIVTQRYTNDNGCDSFITLDLTVHNLPNVRLAHESVTDICIGDTIKLEASGAQYYLFYDQYNDLIETALHDDSVSVRVPSNQNHYYVIGTDEYGCKMMTSVTIIANNCCEIVIPNAFSPNNDGLNDRFGIVTIGNPEDYVLRIYNRWGETVFVSYKVSDKWDGTYQGIPCDAGTYFYHVSTTCNDGATSIQKGEVTLIR